MTRLLGRYVIRQVWIGTLLALLMLLTLDLLFVLIGELGDIGRGSYGLDDALVFTLLSLPGRVYELLPVAALLGSLLWLGHLAVHSELVAMRASGVSLGQIIAWVLQGGMVLVLGMVLLGEWVATAAEVRAMEWKAFATERQLRGGGTRLWVRDGPRMVHAAAFLPDGRLLDVRIIEQSADGRIVAVTRAAQAEFVGDGWRLTQVARSLLQEDRVLREHHAEEWLPRLLTLEQLDVLTIEPQKMSARSLATYMGYLRDNQLATAPYAVAFWQRFSGPLGTLVMLLLALPFLFSRQRERGTGGRLFIGLLLGVAYSLMTRLTAHFGLIYGFPAWISASLSLWGFLLLALWMLYRLHRRQT